MNKLFGLSILILGVFIQATICVEPNIPLLCDTYSHYEVCDNFLTALDTLGYTYTFKNTSITDEDFDGINVYIDGTFYHTSTSNCGNLDNIYKGCHQQLYV